jgi:intracellular sulfur oxidation DsrE/DsrF family protein
MDNDTVYLFTRNGMGDAPVELQKTLVNKFLSLLLEGKKFPALILFYTDGVRLACKGSNVLDELHALEATGVKLILCQTCLNYFKLSDQVQVGIVGGMGDIIEGMSRAGKVISL